MVASASLLNSFTLRNVTCSSFLSIQILAPTIPGSLFTAFVCDAKSGVSGKGTGDSYRMEERAHVNYFFPMPWFSCKHLRGCMISEWRQIQLPDASATDYTSAKIWTKRGSAFHACFVCVTFCSSTPLRLLILWSILTPLSAHFLQIM